MITGFSCVVVLVKFLLNKTLRIRMNQGEEEADWGELHPIEGSSLTTRSMLDMRNPNPFDLHIKQSRSISKQRWKAKDIPVCPYTNNSIKLLDQIREAEELQESTETKQRAFLRKNQLSSDPLVNSSLNLDTDVTAGTSFTNKRTQSDMSNCISIDEAKNLLRRGIARIALSRGCEAATESVQNVLQDITILYLRNLCNGLRHAADNEALTGYTGFYDCLDQVFHDMKIGNLHSVLNFFKEDVIGYHKYLIQKKKKVMQELDIQTRQEKRKQDFDVKQEKPFSGGWLPLQSASEPTSSKRRRSSSKMEHEASSQQRHIPPPVTGLVKTELSSFVNLNKLN